MKDWSLTDLKKGDLNVFSCFACGGGSSMGYKRAGYNMIGINECDPTLVEMYSKNFKPKHIYTELIQDMVKKKDYADDLYHLDILDGSPPCSNFSMAGNREKDWGKKKHFREGQAEQVLDDLFFWFIELAKDLQPKVVISENVTGLIKGNAKGYVKKIMELFDIAGYDTQLFKLNSATMGVPQRRERVFFISRRKDLKLPPIKLSFNEAPISFAEVEGIVQGIGKPLSPAFAKWWKKTPMGKSLSYGHPKGSFFNSVRIHPDRPINTITSASGAIICHYKVPNSISEEAMRVCQTFPKDYNFNGQDVKYVLGMSVPPKMIEGIAREIRRQWFE